MDLIVEPADGTAPLLDAINGAKKTLDVMIFRLDLKEVEKAISISGLGVTPSNDGKIIRVPLPPLTEERRKELTKICKKHGEDTKVHIRGFRRDANEELKKLQKDAKLTEDELRKSEAEIQKLTDQYVQKIDDAIKKKEQEILEV